VFRKLLPLEIEPTISQVLGEAVPSFVLRAGSEQEIEAAPQFARDFSENENPTFFVDGQPRGISRPARRSAMC